MANEKLRHAIACEAARLMYERLEREYFTAKRKAARRLCRGQVKPSDLPSNSEIRDQIQLLARLLEGERRAADLRAMRFAALGMMRLLRPFKPRLIGSVMTGHVRKGSDIDLHLFTDSPALVTDLLDREGYVFDLERKQVVKHNEARVFTHIHIHDRFPFELTVYAEDKAHYVFKSSITGKAIERASIRELEEFLSKEYPDVDLEGQVQAAAEVEDPYLTFRRLLEPLASVPQSPRHHPEGDVLYHSLQVFELAREHRPYDIEFLQAALLHDVGKGIDPQDHVRAGLEAVEGLISERTAFFIEHHMHALELKAGTLGHKLTQRLRAAEDFEDLMLLRELDTAGRVPGAEVCELDEALDFLKELERENG
jgi:predicted nucleotidyltransferase